MKKLILFFSLSSAGLSFAATKTKCLNGSFKACKEIASEYGRTSKKDGAIDFFNAACESQNLKISCQVVTTNKDETLTKALSVAKPKQSALFIMSGLKFDKIYVISETE